MTDGRGRAIHCASFFTDGAAQPACGHAGRPSTKSQTESDVDEKEILRIIIESIPVMLSFYDAQGNFRLLNRECERLLGWSAEEAGTMDLMAACYPDPQTRREVWEFMLSAEPGWRELRVTTRWGTELESLWANKRLTDGSLIGIGIDIRDKKEAEQAVLRSEARLAAAVEASGSGVFEHAVPLEEFCYVSPRCAEILGFAEEELPPAADLPAWFYGRIHPQDRKPAERIFFSFLKGTVQKLELELRVRHRTEREVFVRIRAGAVSRGRSGAVEHVVGVMMDVTEQKLAEAELERRRLRAEDRERRLRELTYELTRAEEEERRRLALSLHDGLQPLLVAAKMKLAAGVKAEAAARLGGETAADVASSSAAQARDVLDRALSYTRKLTYETSPPVLHMMGLQAALRWLVDWMRDNYRLRVQIRLEDGAEPRSMKTRYLLFRIAREMLLNAAKHSGVGEAAVSLSRPERALELVVEDSGGGFDPERSAKLQTFGGGYGLYSIQERLEAVGGRLEIDSAPGRGARFTVVLPD